MRPSLDADRSPMRCPMKTGVLVFSWPLSCDAWCPCLFSPWSIEIPDPCVADWLRPRGYVFFYTASKRICWVSSYANHRHTYAIVFVREERGELRPAGRLGRSGMLAALCAWKNGPDAAPWCTAYSPPWCTSLLKMTSTTKIFIGPVFLCIRISPLGSAPVWCLRRPPIPYPTAWTCVIRQWETENISKQTLASRWLCWSSNFT
jgi:hypothetical protein